MAVAKAHRIRWGLSWGDPPAAPELDERVELPGLDFLTALLEQRPQEWARLATGLDRGLARQVALQVERDQPCLDAVSRLYGDTWGVWARHRGEAAQDAPQAPQEARTAPARPILASVPSRPAQRRQGARAGNGLTPRRLELTDEEVRQLSAFRATPKGGKAPHRGQREYARLAQVYVRLHEAGDTSPPATLAAALGGTSSWTAMQVKQARNHGLLTESPHARQAGGQLTALARTLLAPPEDEAQRDEAPPTPLQERPARPTPEQVRPSREQREAMAKLHEDNRRAVEAMRRPASQSGPLHLLPATCRPLRNLRDVPGQLRPAAEEALGLGWVIGVQPNGHLRWVQPDGSKLTTSPHNHYRGTRNDLARLRRRGLTAREGQQDDARWPEGIGVGSCLCEAQGIGKPRHFTGCPVHTEVPDREALRPPTMLAARA